MRLYGTHLWRSSASGFFSCSTSSRFSMKALEEGLNQTHQTTLPKIQNSYTTTTATISSRPRAIQRQRCFIVYWLRIRSMTGAVRGRTPRHRKKDSAACSTSMPSPSATRAAPCARAKTRNGVGALPYIMS